MQMTRDQSHQREVLLQGGFTRRDMCMFRISGGRGLVIDQTGLRIEDEADD